MGRTLRIEHARAFMAFQKPKVGDRHVNYRYNGAWGGRGSAKSHEFAKLLIKFCMLHSGTRAVCIREVQNTLKDSVKKLLEDKIKEYGVSYAFDIKEDRIVTPGGGVIIFIGMQNHTATSIKSLEGFHIAWFEEAQTMSARSLELLRPTIRTEWYEGAEFWQSMIWFSWNPRKAKDPVDKFLRGLEPYPDSIVIGVTYKDNPWFPDVLRKEMEWDRAHDVDKYTHVWLGGYEKNSEARVFKNFRIEAFDPPPESTSFLLGADWGFSVDPSTLLRAFEQRIDPQTGKPWMWRDPISGNIRERKRLYIDHDLYQVGVETDWLPSFFDGLICGCKLGQVEPCRSPQLHGWARPWPIVSDSARPETISYMRRYGYPRMEASKKGAGSVKEGVMFLQGYEIIIHPRAVASGDEFMSYSYKIDPLTEEVLPILSDKKNHIIDPLRYALERLRGALQIHEAVWG